MICTEAKETVQAYLDCLKEDRNKREAALENQARLLRLTINDNHTTRTMTEVQKLEKAQDERQAKAKARKEKERAAILAVHYYIRACAFILFLTILPPFPWWGGITLTASLAIFPLAKFYHLEVTE